MTERSPDWWVKALGDFGTGLGFDATGDWTSDVLNLAVDGGEYLVDVERSGEDIVLAVLRSVPLPDVDEKTRALLHHLSFERDHPFLLQGGLKGDDVLVVAARLERSESRRLIDAFELIRRVYADMGL